MRSYSYNRLPHHHHLNVRSTIRLKISLVLKSENRSGRKTYRAESFRGVWRVVAVTAVERLGLEIEAKCSVVDPIFSVYTLALLIQ